MQKDVPLTQIVIDLDIEPEQVKKFHDIYLNLLKRQKLVSILKDEDDTRLILEILPFLRDPDNLRSLKENIDIKTMTWEFMTEMNEVKQNLEDIKVIEKHYESMLEEKRIKVKEL